MATQVTDSQWDKALERARELGREYFGRFGCPADLSGEWADMPTAADVVADVSAALGDGVTLTAEERAEVLDECERAWNEAFAEDLRSRLAKVCDHLTEVVSEMRSAVGDYLDFHGEQSWLEELEQQMDAVDGVLSTLREFRDDQ